MKKNLLRSRHHRFLSFIMALSLLFAVVPAQVLAAETAAVEQVSFDASTDAESFDLYSTGSGSFAVQDGKLTPTGDAGEFKAVYKDNGQKINAVSVELHPVGQDGPIFGGLYINASNAANDQDAINALYIGIESNFTGWDDALNRVDVVVGSFPTWQPYSRLVSETGNNNNLFTGGVKEPITLRVDISGNTATITVSLVSNPAKKVVTTYVAEEGVELSAGDVGIRSHYNNACYDNFVVEYEVTTENEQAAPAVVDFSASNASDKFDLYSTGSGGFALADGKLVPAGDAGEFKAIYKESGKSIRSVSVELHPVGTDGPIYGGLYINASDAGNDQDAINALYIGVESNFTDWDDAPNRVDLVIGSFPTWDEHIRVVSETGNNNNLFTGGVKEPLTLRADIYGNSVTVTVSLVSDPTKCIAATYVADAGVDLSAGQVGIRSHRNNAMYDNFAVNAAAGIAEGSAASVGNSGFATLTEAVEAADGSVVKLLASSDEAITADNAAIDLAGNALSNVTVSEGCSLTLADTVSGGSAAVTGSVETFTEVDGKTYLVVGEEGVYSAHAYDVAITHISLDPNNDALGYKAALVGDEVVQQYVTSIGFNLWVDGGQTKTYEKSGTNALTLRLKNILKAGGGEMNINATAFVTLTVGENTTTKTCGQQTTTMKETLQAVDSAWDTYTEVQQTAVKALCDQYLDTVSGWELTNIYPTEETA